MTSRAGWRASAAREDELALFGSVDGQDVVHLQCHFGMDTLCPRPRRGTRHRPRLLPRGDRDGRASSPSSPASPSARASCSGGLDEALSLLGRSRFDLVYVSLGALCWLPSASRWAEQAAGLLRPGGRLFLHDSHPFAQSCGGQELLPDRSYFEEAEPVAETSEQTYTDAERPLTATLSYC